MSTKKTKSAGKKPATPKKAATVATAPAAAEAAELKAAPAPKPQRNGVTQPGEGTACRAIWDACDALKAEGKELTFEALVERLPKINHSTLRTQRQRHKTFHG